MNIKEFSPKSSKNEDIEDYIESSVTNSFSADNKIIYKKELVPYILPRMLQSHYKFKLGKNKIKLDVKVN